MLDVVTNQVRLCDGVTRRNFLRAGYLGLGGMSLGQLMQLRSQAGPTKAKNTSIILLWQVGGPSHLETYDMKPDAPTGYRGPFGKIRTSVPGMEVCDLLPMHTQRADRFSLIRSCTHKHAGHNEGHCMTLTGYPKWDEGRHLPIHPECGAVVNRLFGQCRNGMPVTVGMGAKHYGYVPGTTAGYWGPAFNGPVVDRGLPNASPTVDGRRLDDRRGLLASLDNVRRARDNSGNMDALDNFNNQAFDIITGNKANTAFDLEKETQKTRDRYGKGWGQQALLARRLVEAGVSFVTVGVPGGKVVYNWDDHAVNGDLPTAMQERLPGYDQAVTALIDDVYERGLDQQVMIVVMGEFGRTPQFRQSVGTRSKKLQWGRDHWPGAMSILISGGGKRMGQVIGETDSQGAYPKQRPLDPHDILATFYDHLGVDPQHPFIDTAGRPFPLTNGTPIREL
jgi:hypothetical protein